MTLQRYGGLAALFEAAAFIFGFAIFFAVLGPARFGAAGVEAVRHVAFLAENRAMMSLFNLVIYVAFGAALIVLSIALHERLRGPAPALAGVATGFGLIWAGLVIASGMVANIGIGVLADLHASAPAAAAASWPAYKIMINGLGGGNEIVGGMWVLLVSLAGLRAAALPRLLAWLGIVAGLSGLLTTIPALEEVGAIFGLGLIAWFGWLGIVMLRTGDPGDVK